MASGTPVPFRAQTFAVVSGLTEAPRLLRMLCDELGQATNRIVIPQVLRSYPDLTQQIRRGTVHIAWMPPILAIELSRAAAASVALCSVRNGKSAYHSVLFSRRGSDVRLLSDLAGRHVAWVERTSAAGYVIPRLRIASSGLDPDTLFGCESFHQNHAEVARAVFAGEADVGATFALFDPRTGKLARAGWEESGVALTGAQILATAGPIPSDGIVLSSKLPPALVKELTSAIAQLPRSSAFALRGLFGVEDFVPPHLTHFDELRSLLGSAKKEPV